MCGRQPLKKTRLFLFLFIVDFSIISLCLVSIEIILRTIGFSYPLYVANDEFSRATPTNLDTTYTPDNDLFWVPKDYYKKLKAARASKPSIVFMGDSCTEYGLYHQYLTNLISQEFPNKTNSYFNGGVVGWSSYQGLQQFKRDILGLKPKIITIYFGWNDHWFALELQDKKIARTESCFLNRFPGLRLVQLILKCMSLCQKKDKDPAACPNRVPPEDFRNNLQQIVRLAKSHGIVPVLLTAPTSHEKGKEPVYIYTRWLRDLSELVPLHDKYIAIVRDVARQENVILCDLAEYFADLPKDKVRNEYFKIDGIHPTPEGHKKIAEYLYVCFKKNKLEQFIK